jgi:hypothetical protein
MRCIFCKRDSSGSTSCEHILPESLGNTTAILPPGVVCDRCNNYFSREVERPFLDSPEIRALRFHQTIPSKRGRVPSAQGLLLPGFPIALHKTVKEPLPTLAVMEAKAIDHIVKEGRGTILLVKEEPLPESSIVSRFLAKVAVEALADRLRVHPGGLDYVVDETQLDEIRRYAREGYPRRWPHHARRIYDANRHSPDAAGREVQVVHEFDLLMTPWNELFLVVAVFGLELVINFGGPEIDGYVRWLEENGSVSPLYPGRNSAADEH